MSDTPNKDRPPLPPDEIKSDPAAEPKGHEGTLGGQTPLNAPAGVQSTKKGGVLVEEHPHKE
jgi:hypothetical protein